ncbi:MAG: DUF1080 domain-containing protein [Chthoniobacteraceae bacterium]
MRRLLILSLALSLNAFGAEPNILTDAEKTDGWKLLFDGKTTAGWQALGGKPFPEKGWTVTDGTLHHAKGAGGGDIVTVDAYEDFELAWEWKIAEGGNSGLKYNLPDPAKGVGFEYQLLDDAKHPDSKLHGGTRTTASLYDVLPAAANKTLKPPGEWNASRILVKGNHAEHWLNDIKTVEFEMGSEALKTAIAGSKFKSNAAFGVKSKSPILIQDHGDEISLRSMKIRPLPAK